MKKTNYQRPELYVVNFAVCDVVRTSGNGYMDDFFDDGDFE